MAEKSNFIIYPQNKNSPKSILTTFNPYTQNDNSKKPFHEVPIKLNFPGWKKPTNEWANWVEKLSIKFAKSWQLLGICDGILSSLHEIKPNPIVILALCEFWCPKTNTFSFPWGEATITLEDVMILFGLPVFGEPVNCTLSSDSMKVLLGELCRVRSNVSRSSAKKASYYGWIKYFNYNKVNNESLEHVGFLAYWLSRFVFPDLNERTIGKHVFPIAVLLSQGVKMGLAQAVLACLYQNLTFLTLKVNDFDSTKREISVPGPFQIVYLWALERFPLLGSKLARPLSPGQPRIARWDKVIFKESLVNIRLVLTSFGGFCSQPYALELDNWRMPSFYLENEKILSDCSNLDDDDDELKSFLVCIRSEKVFGIDCAEMYWPQRVAMQFGYDQHILEEIALSGALKSDSEKSKPATDSEKSGLNYVSDSLSNEAAISTPVNEVLDASSFDSGRKRKFSSRKQDCNPQGIVIVDLDDVKVKKVGSVGSDQSSTSSVKRRVGDSADNPLFIAEPSSKMSTTRRKSGTCSQNPIDVENYY